MPTAFNNSSLHKFPLNLVSVARSHAWNYLRPFTAPTGLLVPVSSLIGLQIELAPLLRHKLQIREIAPIRVCSRPHAYVCVHVHVCARV